MPNKQTTDTGAGRPVFDEAGYYMKRTGPLLLDEFWSPTIQAEATAAIKVARAIIPPIAD